MPKALALEAQVGILPLVSSKVQPNGLPLAQMPIAMALAGQVGILLVLSSKFQLNGLPLAQEGQLYWFWARDKLEEILISVIII